MSKLRYIKAVLRMHHAGHISEDKALADIRAYFKLLDNPLPFPAWIGEDGFIHATFSSVVDAYEREDAARNVR